MYIEDLRKQIDKIDAKMLELFEERMQRSRDIARYKQERNLPIFDAKREKDVIDDRISQICDQRLKSSARAFFLTLMDLSKDEQRSVLHHNLCGKQDDKEQGEQQIMQGQTVAFQGIKGAYGEEALFAYFGENQNSLEMPSFGAVIESVLSKKAKFGVLPIENSKTGSVIEVHELLIKHRCFIVGEVLVKIDHCLLAKKNTSIDNIKKVYSHTQGIQQCSEFLSNYPEWEKIPYFNTAISAKMVAECDDDSIAAIASKNAAKQYGLEVLREGINDSKDNYTRFIIISSEQNNYDSDKVSVLLYIKNSSGSLFDSLQPFAKQDINLYRIESRPSPGKNWEYLFFVDFEGRLCDEKVKEAIAELEKQCVSCRVLVSIKGQVQCKMNIYLIGMPGCGKSTIAKLVSEKTNRSFIDLDDYIESKSGRKISDIFEESGERVFRDIESDAVVDVSKMENMVIATGGGCILRKENVDAMKSSGTIVFLDRPLEEIFSDVDIQKRPLLKDGKQKLLKLYDDRIDIYRKSCHHKVDASGNINDALERFLAVIND